MTVDSWSDLAIGIDQNGRYWGITPPPAIGEVFRKSHAVELPLAGKLWKKLLVAFAASESGNTVTRRDLLRQLEYFSLPPSTERDVRARSGAIEEAQIEGLQTRVNVANKRLTDTLTDLRRKLGKVVEGPKRPFNCLRVEGQVIASGFHVRYLLTDQSDRLIFGQPR